MDNLSLHIEYLLLRHDCVVVPGLGAFINVRLAAHYDAATRRWMPPTREVRFNGALSHDDGLLANSLARKNSLLFADGRDLLARETSRLRTALADDGEVSLGHLGILSQSEGIIAFQPHRRADRTASTLGYLPAYDYPASGSASRPSLVASRLSRDVPSGSPSDLSDLSDSTSSLITQTSGIKKRRFDTDRNYYIPVNKMLARTAACLLLVAAVALSVVMPMSQRQDQERIDRASVLPVPASAPEPESKSKFASDPTFAASRLSRDVPSDTASGHESIPESDRDACAPSDATASATPTSLSFHAVVATFTRPHDAEQYVKMNQNCGYTLSVINTATKCRVVAASGASEAEVREQMRATGFRSQFPEAWIWQHKK